MNTSLQQAAQAMIDRWESPDWKDTPHTAHYIAELRKALDAELAQSVEPVAWVKFARKKPTAKALSFSRELTIFEKANGFASNPLYLHPPQPPQPQATIPALRECWYESNELKVCRKCGQMHDKAIAAQGEKP